MSALRHRNHGFTLIELLIVVAIIAILAAIAVPNFLEAQTRSKVARVKADFRSIGTALGSYFVDNQAYPYPRSKSVFLPYHYELSTPIPYLTSIPGEGPFSIDAPSSGYIPPLNRYYFYVNYKGWAVSDEKWAIPEPYQIQGYGLSSWGPAGNQSGSQLYPFRPVETRNEFFYDPTNGTVSKGEIAYLIGVQGVSGFPN